MNFPDQFTQINTILSFLASIITITVAAMQIARFIKRYTFGNRWVVGEWIAEVGKGALCLLAGFVIFSIPVSTCLWIGATGLINILFGFPNIWVQLVTSLITGGVAYFLLVSIILFSEDHFYFNVAPGATTTAFINTLAWIGIFLLGRVILPDNFWLPPFIMSLSPTIIWALIAASFPFHLLLYLAVFSFK